MSCSFDSDRPRRLAGEATASATPAEPFPLASALRFRVADARPPRFATARPPEPLRALPLFAICLPNLTQPVPNLVSIRSLVDADVDPRALTCPGFASRGGNAPLSHISSSARAEPCPG